MSLAVQHRRAVRIACEANTPLAGEFWYDITLGALRIGDGATLGGFLMKRWRYSFPISPPQIAANQNNYNPTDLTIGETLFISSDAARNITGIVAGGAGARMTVINRGAFEITLKNEDANSTAANRFMFGSDIIVQPFGSVELNYSATDSRWMRAGGGLKFFAIAHELLLTGVISPAQIAVNQNDYAPAGITTASTLRLSTDAARNITGLADARDGAIKIIVNVGANPLTLKNADTGSAAANRFDFGADVTLAGNQSGTVRYDGTAARWKLIASTAGAAVAAGAVTAQTLAPSALSSGLGMINGTIVESRAGNAATYAIKTLAGNDPSAADPVYAVFRNATAGAGDYVVRVITSALSLTISSGSSLSALNGTRLWLTLHDTGSGVALGVINCVDQVTLANSGRATVFPLQRNGLATTVAEGGAGAADNAGVFYTAAALTNRPYVVIGYATYEAALSAGVWNVAPTVIELYRPGMPLPGMPIQLSCDATGAYIAGSTLMPHDNTIPQSNEGDQFLSAKITASATCNLLRVRAVLVTESTTAGYHVAAVFRNSDTDALAATSTYQDSSGATRTCVVQRCLKAGDLTEQTFKIRAGAQGGTFILNGHTLGGVLGGRCWSSVEIEEIMG